MNLRTWTMASRAPFFLAVIMPSLMGGAVAYYHGRFDMPRFLMILAGMVLANGGTNFINDYFDFRSGADKSNRNRTPFSGGSPFLPQGVLRPSQVLVAGLACFAGALLIALFLAFAAGYMVLVLAGAGGFIGFFYTAPPLRLGYRGVGEALTGLALGPLTVAGVYYVMTGTITAEALVVSFPIGVLVAAILYVNEVPDHDSDKLAGKRHLVVLVGKERAARSLPFVFALVYGAIIAGVLGGIMPAWTLIAILTLPLAADASRIAARNYDDVKRYIPAQARTIATHSLTGLLLTAGYLAASFIG